jgi:hypothetical protein
VSTEVAVPLAAVCRASDAPRSTVDARRAGEEMPTVRRKRGPKTALSDGELTEVIKAVIRAAPFAGEGHRKVTARLRRDHGIRVGRKRVLRLMRTAGLLAPQRARGRRKPDRSSPPGTSPGRSRGSGSRTHRPTSASRRATAAPSASSAP